jgi:DNA-binding NarL/FixJ family response regulator
MTSTPHIPTIGITVRKPHAERAMKPKPAPSDPIAVRLADSSQIQVQLLTGAMRRHPEFKVGSCPVDVDIILESLQHASVDVLLLAANTQNGAGQDMTLLRRLHISYPRVPKVLLLESFDRDMVVNAFRSGARGLFYFTRVTIPLSVQMHSGRASRPDLGFGGANRLPRSGFPGAVAPGGEHPGEYAPDPGEEQVVALVAEGLSNRDIAGELALSEHTVKKYLFRIFDKLGISTRVELVLYAFNHGDHRPAEWLPAAPA